MGAVNGGNGAGYGQQQQRRDDPMAILNECRNIDNGVEQILKNLERLQYLQQQSLDDPDASQNTSTNRQLDSLSSETMTLYRSFVDRIRKLKGMPGAGSPQNSAQVGRVDRKLKDAIQRYQTVDADFRKKLQAQMARQYRIVRPDASESEVREATEDTSSNQVFSQAVSTAGQDMGSGLIAHSFSKATAAASLSRRSEPCKDATRLSRRSSNR
jgi:syntaxin 1B/2/3